MNLKSGVISFLFAFVFLSAVEGSKDSIGVIKINEKLHVKYLVSPGETIYGISTKYGVPVSDLMELNPELENGLKVGQVIHIPYNPEAMKPARKYDDNVIVHKVQAGETFYSLSKKYNTTVDELMKLNNIQLKAGQEIVVGRKDQQPTATNNQVTTPTNTNTNNTNTTTNTNSNNTTTSTNTNTNTANNTTTNNTTANNSTQNTTVKKEDPKTDPKTTTTSKTTTTTTTNTTTKTNTTVAPETTEAMELYPYDPTMKQVLVIPFDPYLYFSDADDEIAAKSNMQRTKVRQVFRKRLNAMLEPQGYETIRLLGGKAKDSLSDLNKIYGMVTYNYQQVVVSPFYKEEEAPKPVVQKKGNAKDWIEKTKNKITNPDENTSKYDLPKDHGSYFGVVIKNQDFFTYFNQKYSVDYYIFVSQFEVKTNYEHCLDRAAQNYDRTFTTHYSIFDNTGKQISGNKFKTHYNSNSNYIYTIVADNVEKIANRIIAEMPPPNGN